MTSNDISTLLRNWPHEPGKLNVRIFEAEDGRECIQLRIELGVVQMELHGRTRLVEFPHIQEEQGYQRELQTQQIQLCTVA